MAPLVPYGHPTAVRAGDTWTWRISFTDYPASEGWALSYAIVPTANATQAPLVWSAAFVTDDDNEYTVTIPIATTDDFTAGGYRLTAFLTLAGARYSPYSQPLLVAANSAALTAGQGLSHAETMLAAIEAVLESRASADVESYQINGRALNRTPIRDLKRLRTEYRTAVWKERNPGRPLPSLRVYFGNHAA
jgi:hypothetical protein